MIKKTLPLRIGVGEIVLNNKNKIFVGKRKDNPVDKWQMPQGGVDKNENFVTAMKRELYEETGFSPPLNGCQRSGLDMRKNKNKMKILANTSSPIIRSRILLLRKCTIDMKFLYNNIDDTQIDNPITKIIDCTEKPTIWKLDIIHTR